MLTYYFLDEYDRRMLDLFLKERVNVHSDGLVNDAVGRAGAAAGAREQKDRGPRDTLSSTVISFVSP